MSQAEVRQRLHASVAPGVGSRSHRGADALGVCELRRPLVPRAAGRTSHRLLHSTCGPFASCVVVFATAGAQGYRCHMLPCHAPALSPTVWP